MDTKTSRELAFPTPRNIEEAQERLAQMIRLHDKLRQIGAPDERGAPPSPAINTGKMIESSPIRLNVTLAYGDGSTGFEDGPHERRIADAARVATIEAVYRELEQLRDEAMKHIGSTN
jgi:hypothetical protein